MATWMKGALLLAVTLAGCGGDDGNYGTCDRVELVGGCIESTGDAPSIRNQQEGCEDAGGTWSTDACPVEGSIGCCEYTFGLEFRECFYENSMADDPAATCAEFDGVWTPAP